MREKSIICPFCGKDITNQRFLHSIPQEETINRDFSIESTWVGSYIKEEKHVRHYRVYCCKQCYEEYDKYETWSERYILFAAPIGFVAGLVYGIILRSGVDDATFLNSIMPCIMTGVIGVFIAGSPNLFLYLLYNKNTTYKHASKCNAIRWG